MRLRENRTMSVLLGAAVLVGGVNIAAYAATGGNFLLGKSNSAGKTTTLTNTGKGAPLSLKGRASAPPLTVSSSRKVARLNADKLDGKDSTAFVTNNGSLAWNDIPVYTDNGWKSDPALCDLGVAQYAVSHGIVYLRGGVCEGTGGNQILTLPTVARPNRPATYVHLMSTVLGIANQPVWRPLQIEPGSGAVFTTDDAAGMYVSLEGISFAK